MSINSVYESNIRINILTNVYNVTVNPFLITFLNTALIYIVQLNVLRFL